MTALDTNVIVRLLARDEPEQFDRARKLVESSDCYLPDTAVLEAGWVLDSLYGFSRAEIAQALTAFLGLANVHVQDAERLRHALKWYAEGLDFADALHLAASQSADRFVTFDRAFVKRAAGKSPCIVQAL